jgi:hypothetical protein
MHTKLGDEIRVKNVFVCSKTGSFLIITDAAIDAMEKRSLVM